MDLYYQQKYIKYKYKYKYKYIKYNILRGSDKKTNFKEKQKNGNLILEKLQKKKK